MDVQPAMEGRVIYPGNQVLSKQFPALAFVGISDNLAM
jgi:hypothetical protein